MHARQRAPLPQDRQTGLPAGILFQPAHIGGSLGFGGKPKIESVWDGLEAEASALAPGAGVPGAPGVGPDLRQNLNDFVVQARVKSKLVIPYNPNRIYLMVQNRGSANVFISFGHAASDKSSFQISPGPGFIEPILGTVSSVHLVSAGGVQPVIIIEGFRI